MTQRSSPPRPLPSSCLSWKPTAPLSVIIYFKQILLNSLRAPASSAPKLCRAPRPCSLLGLSTRGWGCRESTRTSRRPQRLPLFPAGGSAAPSAPCPHPPRCPQDTAPTLKAFSSSKAFLHPHRTAAPTTPPTALTQPLAAKLPSSLRHTGLRHASASTDVTPSA